MDRDRVVFAAASMRFVLGIFALTLLPVLYPKFGAHRWVFAAYLVWASFAQFLIWKGLGGLPRSVVSGIVDLTVLTFIVHRVGSASTMMVSVYVLASVLNTLVVGRRVGMTLALLASAMYCGILLTESFGWLPYAPDGPPWASGRAPLPFEASMAGLLVSLITIASTQVVGFLVQRNRMREAQLVAANERLEQLSQRDPLTGLFNRGHLMECLETELARVRRGHPLAVVMIDLDRFKRINDEHGHLQGDTLLVELAESLADSTRATDVAGRYGGDELVVILRDTDAEQAESAAERFAQAIRRVGQRFEPEHPVTASVGVAIAEPEDFARGLLRRADERAYRAKQQGGDRVIGAT